MRKTLAALVAAGHRRRRDRRHAEDDRCPLGWWGLALGGSRRHHRSRVGAALLCLSHYGYGYGYHAPAYRAPR